MKRIGIYIGAFDPIHNGHLDFADDALNTYGLERIYFLVEPSPRHKQGVKALNHRVNMAILGVAGHPRLGTIVPKSKISLDHYIQLLQNRFGGRRLALIIPEDALKRFFRMPNLLTHNFSNMDILVGLRKQTPDEINLRLRLLSETSGLKFRFSWFNTKGAAINSYEIKKKLKLGIHPKEIPPAVYDYIVTKNLYAAVSSA